MVLFALFCFTRAPRGKRHKPVSLLSTFAEAPLGTTVSLQRKPTYHTHLMHASGSLPCDRRYMHFENLMKYAQENHSDHALPCLGRQPMWPLLSILPPTTWIMPSDSIHTVSFTVQLLDSKAFKKQMKHGIYGQQPSETANQGMSSHMKVL